MLPNHQLSPVVIYAPFLYPDDIDPQRLVDLELGGIGISDPTAGLRYQVWTAFVSVVGVNSEVWIEADNTPPTKLFELINISDISLTFDQNMHPFIAFVQNGNAGYWWYDPLASGFVFTYMAPTVGIPKCCLDDKRPLQITVGYSDILLFYVRAGNLCYREQRDRYLVEYVLASDVVGEVLLAGMNHVNRIQVAVGLIG